MPTPTYTPMANITLSSSAASVTFSSISQAYRDLVLVVQVKASGGIADAFIKFNSDSTSANYPAVYAQGYGSGTYSGTATNAGIKLYQAANIPTTEFVQANLSIMDYSASDKHKTTLTRANFVSDGTIMQADRWANTAAITTFSISTPYNSFASGSTFALYGIAA